MFLWIVAKKIGLWSFYTLATVGASGSAYQYISTKLDEKAYPAPGRMIDIGGYRLHIQETGTEHSGPTVILDAGAGNYSLDWALVQPKIAEFARVVSYDRAGDGWSDESPLTRTSKNMMIELHTLLKKAGIPGPYIFVGHSFGGLNAQIYAHQYPEEIAGIILVDSSHEDQAERLPKPPVNFESPLLRYGVLSAAYLGIIRLVHKFTQQANHLPADLEKIRNTHICTPKFFRTAIHMMRLFNESNKQLKEYGVDLGDTPLIVISAGKGNTIQATGGLYTQEQLDAMFNIMQELQRDLASRSSKSKQMIAERSGHMIPDEQPEIIVRAVKEMLDEYR